MTWLLIPESDRTAARKLVKRIDEILGYPRTHTADEVTRRGRAPHAPLASIYTETAMDIRLHDNTGATILHGAVGINLDRDLADQLRERDFDVDGAKRKLRQIIIDRGWEVRADLPGDPNAWTRVAPRDGQTGSTTGEPIPEGSE